MSKAFLCRFCMATNKALMFRKLGFFMWQGQLEELQGGVHGTRHNLLGA